MHKSIFFLTLALTGCASQMPAVIHHNYPAVPHHKHTATKPLLADYHAFKPVEVGDWKALNRRVSPQ